MSSEFVFKPRRCPEGFQWDSVRYKCVPTKFASPGVVVSGLCEDVVWVPDKETVIDRVVRPYIRTLAAEIGAIPQQQRLDDLITQDGEMTLIEALHWAAATIPLHMSPPELDIFGKVCRLPYTDLYGPFDSPASEEDEVPRASRQVIDAIAGPVREEIHAFNRGETIP